MALSDSTEQSDKKSAGPPYKGHDKREKLHTKVIVRRLPPNMDLATFLNQISPVPPYDYLYMVKGDASLGEYAFSRTYINFTNSNDIFDFKEKFDNYVFLDSAGHEYPAVVEFSAFQKIPKKRNKNRVDPKCGMIESDPYYVEFLEMLNKPPEQDEKPEYSYQIVTENKNDSTTPLLEFVKNKRAEKMRFREERREERKRKELERKRFREDERKKRQEDKSPVKGNFKLASHQEKYGDPSNEKPDVEPKKTALEKGEKDEAAGEKPEKASYYNKNKDKKFEDRKRDGKPGKFPPKKEYMDKRDYKGRRDDYKEREYKSKYDDSKTSKEVDPKLSQKRVKKYSEKREERKLEALKKLEQEKAHSSKEDTTLKENTENLRHSTEGTTNKPKESPDKSKVQHDDKSGANSRSLHERVHEKRSKNKDSESSSQKNRIRNKDRPTIALYRPGMLSKRKQGDPEPSEIAKDSKKE